MELGKLKIGQTVIAGEELANKKFDKYKKEHPGTKKKSSDPEFVEYESPDHLAKDLGMRPKNLYPNVGKGTIRHVKDDIEKVEKKLESKGYKKVGNRLEGGGMATYYQRGDKTIKLRRGDDFDKGGTHIDFHEGPIPTNKPAKML